MKTYRITDILSSFGLFLDSEVEAADEIDAKEQILNEIMDNLGNYIDIELEEVDWDDSEDPDEYDRYEDSLLEKEFNEKYDM